MRMHTHPDARPRVMLAEDDVLRQVLLLVLRRWGYSVVAVTDGAIALAVLLAPNAPRVAILDGQMPGMSGPEVCRRLRERGDADTFIVLFTGNAELEDEWIAAEAGVNAILPKRCDLECLRGLLVEATTRHERHPWR